MITADMIATMRCDRCRLKLRNDNGTYWFASPAEALFHAKEMGWKVDREKALCPNCKNKKP